MAFKKLRTFLEMIKFEHTLFALPFAYTGSLLVEGSIPSGRDLFWITMAMVGARTAAMSLNRVIDSRMDAQNPRTAGRALPRGLLTAGEVWVYSALSLGLLMVSAYHLSVLAFSLAPVAVFVLVAYSYTKRFTWLCHFCLGLALSMAPVGAWIAISGRFDIAPLVLGAGVVFWVSGFDIVYACDDYEFDRAFGVHSIPARFGIGPALKTAVHLHIAALTCFFAVGLLLELGAFYYVGLLAAAFLVMYQHRLVSPGDLSRAGIAFFNLNAMLSSTILVFTLLDTLVPVKLTEIL